MKIRLLFATVAAAAMIIGAFAHEALRASTINDGQRYEYATIRWGGRENTCVIRPGAHVEMVGAQLSGVRKPERADERAFYMNVVLNAMAKEGYEFAGMTSDDIVLKRPVWQ